ncbi:MAG: TonB-dependent receptor [Sphingomonadales bacterium]|nr:TonB-dependent receptor [Sphingomonadales bacterium]
MTTTSLNSFRRGLFAAAALASVSGSPAYAADAGDAASEGGEIIVTATKRAENVQNVPISISVIGGDAVAKRGLTDSLAVSRVTAGLVAESATGAANPRFRLRGVGTNDFSATATPAVGIYEDEVYLMSGAAQSFPLYDLDHVEVLRGPQGSLWGKNTTAGAIHFVTQKPTQQTQGYARVGYGSDDTRLAEGAIGGALVEDVLAARIAGIYQHRDGQYHNAFTGKRAGRNDQWDVRGQLLWTISPDATLLLKGHGGKSVIDVPLKHIGLLAGGTDFDGYAEAPGKRSLSNNGSGYTRANRAGTDARLNIDLGNVTLTDIASYETSSSIINSDDDANPISKYHERYGGKARTFTNELRLASDGNGPLSWIAGVYYLHDRTRSFGQLGLYSPINFGVDGAAYDFTVKTENVAGFGSVSYAVTDRLKLTAGGRYTWEKKSIAGTANDYITNPADVLDASHVGTVYIDTAAGVYNDGFGNAIAPTQGSKSWKKFTWDVSADYRLTDDALLFGRVSRGFRSGNYNTYVASPGDLSVYDPETLTSYELGVKTSWFDKRLTLNATAFHYDYKDIQVTVLQSVGTKTTNAAAARVNGFEIEAVAKPVEGLTLTGGWGFQDSKYKNFTNASVPFPINQGVGLDLSGQSFERAPKQTINLSGEYVVPVGTGHLSFLTDWRYTSRYHFHVWSDATNNNPAPFLASPAARELVRDSFSQKALWLGNARIAFTTAGDQFEIAGWVRNLANTSYRTNTFAMFFNRSMSYYPGELRTYGATVTARF